MHTDQTLIPQKKLQNKARQPLMLFFNQSHTAHPIIAKFHHEADHKPMTSFGRRHAFRGSSGPVTSSHWAGGAGRPRPRVVSDSAALPQLCGYHGVSRYHGPNRQPGGAALAAPAAPTAPAPAAVERHPYWASWVQSTAWLPGSRACNTRPGRLIHRATAWRHGC